MTQQPRSTLHLRLLGENVHHGEIPLVDLAKIADQTQRVITRIARGMIDDERAGRTPLNIVEATTLSLVGLRSGSTVLDMALSRPAQDALSAADMPADLGEMALAALAESLEILSENEPDLVLPVGIDKKAAKNIDQWLRSLRSYNLVAIDAELASKSIRAEIIPKAARQNLQKAASQPAMPYVSAEHQALTGRLYALNLRTGTFRIEDDTGHSIQLTVPEDMRSEAAQMIDTRVRAIGKASLDERHRLRSFRVAALEEHPEFVDQMAFFERHELVMPSRSIADDDLTLGAIPELSDDEINGFIAALEAE